MADHDSDNPSSRGNLSLNNATVGGDVTGRDHIVAGGHIVQAGAGAVVNIYGSATQAAGEGLAALVDLMRSEDVRREVISFQTDFRRTRRELDKVRGYKAIHDSLHTLQFQCYQLITDLIPHFPDTEWAVSQLSLHHGTLQNIVSSIRTAIRHPALSVQDTAWVEDLVQAQNLLGEAIESLDKKQLGLAVWRLKRVLKYEPTRINVGLVEATRELQLPMLIRALSQVRTSLPANLSTDLLEQAGRFETGVAALGDLDQGLTALVGQHDRWQKIEVDFQLIEDSLEMDLTDLVMAWPDLKVKVDRLCGDSTEDWAATLKAESVKLEQALADNAPIKIKNSFRKYRNSAGWQFYRVDGSLKNLCDQLREVGDPLASVLSMIGE